MRHRRRRVLSSSSLCASDARAAQRRDYDGVDVRPAARRHGAARAPRRLRGDVIALAVTSTSLTPSQSGALVCEAANDDSIRGRAFCPLGGSEVSRAVVCSSGVLTWRDGVQVTWHSAKDVSYYVAVFYVGARPAPTRNAYPVRSFSLDIVSCGRERGKSVGADVSTGVVRVVCLRLRALLQSLSARRCAVRRRASATPFHSLSAAGVGRAQSVTLHDNGNNLVVEQRCVPPECGGLLATAGA